MANEVGQWRSATRWRGRASRFRIKETLVVGHGVDDDGSDYVGDLQCVSLGWLVVGEISIGDDGRRRIVVVGVVEM